MVLHSPAAAAALAGLLALTTLAGCGSTGPAAVPPEPSLPELAPDPATDVRTPEDAAKRISVPMLLAVATGDPYSISAGEARSLINAGSAASRGTVIVRDGSTHGWDLLRSPDIDGEVITFLKANS